MQYFKGWYRLFRILIEVPKEQQIRDINISGIRNSVIVLGDNNVVRNEYKELSESLEDLRRHIRMNSQITDEEKISHQADIDAI